ncbi:pyrimidine-nucleoside phosphorylase [Ignavibacteriales bacterium]
MGDKTTFIILPIVVAAGIKSPQISGRGLGHTGGTLDKMEAIPGLNTRIDIKQYREIMKNQGGLIIGQTAEIAPADKLLYALRDVTGAVPTIPLIIASIMSKKMAEGTDGLVLDVKTGSGAFMRTLEESKNLALGLQGVAKSFNKKCIAMITEMSQPLGYKTGNWNEIQESADILKGFYVEDLCEISFALSGAMIMLGGKAETIEEGIEISRKMVSTGKAFDKFLEIVEAQGGDISYVVNPEKYPVSSIREKLYAPSTGHVSAVNGYEIGMSMIELKAGRMAKEDAIDFKSGLHLTAKVGEHYYKGQEIGYLEGEDAEKIESVKERVLNSISFSEEKVEKLQLIKEIIY